MDIQEQQEIWIFGWKESEENYKKIFHAFYQFGMPVFDMLAKKASARAKDLNNLENL